jgi:hypothetical protein
LAELCLLKLLLAQCLANITCQTCCALAELCLL